MAPKVKQKTLDHPFKVEEKQPAEEISPAVEVESQDSPLPARLTVETLLYVLIIGLAVALRLWQLGAYPLSGEEATQSLAALALYQGQPVEAGQYSPLLLSLNTLFFILFGSSDGTARLATVLLGLALVILPLTLRRQLGRPVCLIASLLLAISPTTLYLSRTLNGEIGVAVGGLMLVAGFFNWVDENRPGWLWLIAGGLALLLTTGPMAYSLLVVFGLIVLLRWPAFKALMGTAHQAGSDTEERKESEAGTGAADSREASASLSPDRETGLRKAAIVFLASLAILATTAAFNISGFSQIGNFGADWVSRFGFQTRPEAGFNAVFLLTIYEPLILVAGLTGLALTLTLHRNLLGTVFGGWFMGILVLDLVMGGRPNGNVILAVVPLTFLAAIALAELGQGVRRRGTWDNEGILVGAGLVIAGFAYIGLAGWLIRTCGAEDRLCQYSWLQPVAALALFLVIVAFFGLLSKPEAALRGAALAGVALGLLVTINIGWHLNYGPLMNLGYQPLAGIPASPGLEKLAETLTTQSNVRVGDPTLLDVTLAGVDSPALRWQLRDFDHLQQANSLSPEAAATAIITSPANGEGLDLGQAYFGQDFDLDAVWSPVGLGAKNFIQWLIYRQVNDLPQSNRVILWLRVEEQ